MLDFLNISFAHFTKLEYVVFTINLLLFLFSQQIVSLFSNSSDKQKLARKVSALRAINGVLLIFYIGAIFFHDVSKQISHTGLTFLIAFILVNLIQVFILKKFGRERTIDEVQYHTETYQSEIFNLITVLVASITVIVLVINIWGFTDWLKATSVLGVLAIMVFSTKDVWAPDNINGLIMLYNGDMDSGSIVRIDELNLLAITIQTSLTQTEFRDLRKKHKIVVPNARLRNCKIDILSQSPASGLFCYVDFNIAYGVTSEQVTELFKRIFIVAVEHQPAINKERDVSIKLISTGDHAVTWRLGFWVKSPFQMLDCEFAVNKAAYDCSLEAGISLATPLTHEVKLTK
jgi:hypothetical protein